MSEHYESFGQGPRPTTGAEFVAALKARASTESDAEYMHALLDATTVEFDGDDIALFAMDSSGIVVTTEQLITDPPIDGVAAPTATIVARTPGKVREAVFVAHPVTVAGLPIEIDAIARGLSIEWVDASDGTYGISDAQPISGEFEGSARLRVAQAGIAGFVEQFANLAAQEFGVTVQDVDVQLAQAGERGVRVDAKARVAKGFLGASVTVAGVASVSDALVLTLSDVKVSSGNMLVGGLLATVRSKVDAIASKPIPLADGLPAGVRVTRADVVVDGHVTIHVALG